MSDFDSLDKVMGLSKFPLFFFKAQVFFPSPGPYNVGLHTRLQEACGLIRGVVASKFYRQAVFNFRALSGVSLTVILAELKINPKKVISCLGSKVDFSGCIANPSLSNKVMVSAMLLTQDL